VISELPIPLEDELGDVIEKAMGCAGLNPEELSAKSGVPAGKILDAIDYRPELTSSDLAKLARVLGLNEVGLCALGLGKYPMPETGALPFCVWPLRMPHGIGVVNAYIVGEFGASSGLLFDTGIGLEALHGAWPDCIGSIGGVFLTHVEAEHAGGLCEVVRRFGVESAYVPFGSETPCGRPMGEGERVLLGGFEVIAFSTPGHSSIHNCYRVASAVNPGRWLLVSGDLVFAGSAGGAFFHRRHLRAHLRRVLDSVPPDTVVAPGHGPMTTAGNETRFNPFLG
jgi:hydroxyacylglutathione hydrolase